MPTINKSRILHALVEQLQRQLHVARKSQQQTQQGATHEESRPENDKDTRALEATYLARGQAQRVADLEQAIALVSAVPTEAFAPGAAATAGALVQVEDNDSTLWYLLAPAGGGIKLSLDGIQFTVLTPNSPVGRALLGRRSGDDVDIKTPQGTRECSIAGVF
jgi:transcription elongation GreA/GreB family factor